ncbi:MAG: hypothetical protein VW270_24695 [Candidatus Poseidoniales archaeon]
MIDTEKEVKNILFDLGVEGDEYGDLVEYISNLIAEVKRLRKAIIKVAFDEHESVYEMKQALVKVIE